MNRSKSQVQFLQALGPALTGQRTAMAFLSEGARTHAFQNAKRELDSLKYRYRTDRKGHKLVLGAPWNGEIHFLVVQRDGPAAFKQEN